MLGLLVLVAAILLIVLNPFNGAVTLGIVVCAISVFVPALALAFGVKVLKDISKL